MIRRFTLRSVFVTLVALFFGQPMHLFAQNEEKLSISTQIFLQELSGQMELDVSPTVKAREKVRGLHPVAPDAMRKYDRFVARPDTIDGQVYMSCFITLDDVSNTSELKALGVKVQETFTRGRITALIPVDKIEEVSDLANVKRVKAATLMRPSTFIARQKTNTDDVITLSTDAIAEGLTKKYDGSGVVLGIIDTGIDFQHIAFKDKDGNYRMKRAYVYNGTSAKEYTSFSGLTTDDKSGDHGTHTSSTAGGSSVLVNGSTVTVTDDHANATYGGMAPGSDLYLAGVKDLNDTYMQNALKAMVTYADGQNKPLVVSNSWGSHLGPHDGTGDWADLVSDYFGDNHPNHVILFAASNDAGKSTGGISASATSSSSSPFGTIIRSHYYSDTDDGFFYTNILASAWAHTTANLTCKVYVLNSSTGAIVNTVTVTPTTSGAPVNVSTYYSGNLYAFKNYVSAPGKTQIMFYANELESKSYDSNYNSNYTLAFEIYPNSGSTTVDVWAGGYAYFTSHLTTSGHKWTAGSDLMSVSDEATIPDAISIGAYVSVNTWKDYNGTSHDMSDEYTLGDIAYFSSYATAEKSPTGLQYPWITAPGARLIAGINHNHTTSVDNYSYWGNYFKEDLVVNNTTNPYAEMEGTSMATPVAAGIVALWMQAAKEVGKNMTVNDIKEVMRQTAIKDSYTSGTNASHFGQGKIDALAGIKYILGASASPTIKVDKTELVFEGYATRTYTETISVTGINLEGNITVSKSGSNVFSVDKTRITQSNGSASAEITVTYAPTTAGTQTGTITLSSNNAENVTISLTGTAEAATPTIIADKESLEFTALLDKEVSQTINVEGRFLTGNVMVTLTDPNGVFSMDKTSFESTEEGVSVSITFNSAEEGTFAGSLLLASAGAASVTINLSATARDGGTASDPYLNISKYATIDEAGWNTSYVNTLYKYTEYEEDEIAWLTMPVYGAYSSKAYSPKAQAWISYSGTGYSSITWTANDIFGGSNNYFTSAASRSFGATSGTTEQSVSFYVTNVTGAKLYGKNTKNVNSSYPTSLKVYECEMNADGSLTAASEIAKSAQSTTASANVNISVTDLDATKIYKVVAAICQGYLYEIGFQTPIEVVKTPRLSATPTEIVFDSIYATTEATKTFTVSGKYLEGDVSISVSDENEVFSVDKTAISVDETTNGAEVTVTFHPVEAGNFTGAITLSSMEAEDVVIALSGTAEPATPTILVDNQALTFSANIDSEQSQTFTVTGRFINADVNLTLTDANRVFSVSPAMLSTEAIAAGAEVTITFNASQEGTYAGTLTLSSEGAEPVTIQLSASANNGGTASDPFLNIAKYATIDEAGWNTTYVNNLYKYTEYEEDEVAWLTLPVYGAWVGTYYNNHPQKWIESDVTNTNNKYAGTSWNGNGELLGSSPYFSSASARAMGYNSRTNSTKETFSFYVSNTTAVKLLGLGQSRTNSTYPATLKVYECEVSADGTPVASSTALQSYSNSVTSGTFTLSATDLDATKVYKIEAATYRSYLCEIAFQTSLKKPVQLGDVNNDGEITIADVTALVNIVLGKDTEGLYNHLAADVNQDDDITIADVTALVNRLLGK